MKNYRFSLILIIFIAFTLRFYNLTYHSLWFDEAVSVHWARQSVPRILEVGFNLVEDRLPPLYYLMLKGWTGLAGFNEVGVRSLSVFIGVLLIPVTANIAQRLFNRRVALLTALLVALNPFLIWYAQEARMYAQAALFGTLCVWAFLQMTAGSQTVALAGNAEDTLSVPPALTQYDSTPRLWGYQFLFITSAIAALYSHLYAGFLLPALGLWLIISYPRAWKLWLRFAVSGLLITLAFFPLATATWRFSGEATPGDLLNGLIQRAWWLLQVFTVWKAPLSPTLQLIIPTTFLIFAFGAYIKLPTPMANATSYQLLITPSHPLLLITLLLITPFIIANLLLLRNYLAFFGERYFIVMVPWLLILTARGTDNLVALLREILPSRPIPQATGTMQQLRQHAVRVYPLHFTNPIFSRLRYLPLLPLLFAAIIPIPGQWSGPAAKEFWRQSVAYLAEHATAEDAILIHPDWVRFPFQFYFEGPGQTYAAFSDVTPATPLDGPLEGVIDGHSVIWLIQSHLDGPDPNRLVEQWFAARYPLVTELYPPGIALKGYASGYQLDRLPAAATPIDIEFEEGLRLVGFQADSVAIAVDEFFHPPSGWVHLTLYWTADQAITGEVVPFAHLVGPEGVWGINLDRANDALKLFPPSRWPADPNHSTIIRHDLDINLNPAASPGIYQLVVGLAGQEEQHVLTEVEIR